MPRRHSKQVWVSLAAAVLLILPLAAGARPPGGAMPGGGGPGGGAPGGGPPGAMSENRLEGLVEELGLDTATLAKVDEVLDASRDRGRKLHRDLRSAHDEMRSLLDVSSPDEAAIFAQIDVISGLQGELEKNRLGTLIRVRALLSPEARGRLLESMKRRPSHRHRPEAEPPLDRPR